eukprot:scaffold49012_cov37-Tisochrysis_lutea.AAC.4
MAGLTTSSAEEGGRSGLGRARQARDHNERADASTGRPERGLAYPRQDGSPVLGSHRPRARRTPSRCHPPPRAPPSCPPPCVPCTERRRPLDCPRRSGRASAAAAPPSLALSFFSSLLSASTI